MILHVAMAEFRIRMICLHFLAPEVNYLRYTDMNWGRILLILSYYMNKKIQIRKYYTNIMFY